MTARISRAGRRSPFSLLLFVVCALANPALFGCSSPDSSTTTAPPASQVTDKTPRQVKCESDLECSGGTYCDPLRGCVTCLYDTHCGDQGRCIEGACDPLITCQSDANCEAGPHKTCDALRGYCVDCVSGAQCGESQKCDGGRCLDVKRCVNTLDCAAGSVCDRASGECVECIGDADCQAPAAGGAVEASGAASLAARCVANRCLKSCASDNECRGAGQLCNRDAGHCAQCVRNEDCPERYHCAGGACKLDVCAPGTSKCDVPQTVSSTSDYGVTLECNADGSGLELRLCAFAQSCVDAGGLAVCVNWSCDPGQKSCNEDASKVFQCGADGLRAEVQDDCAARGEVCFQGACVPRLCEPGKRLCEGKKQVIECQAPGLSYANSTTCLNTEACVEGNCATLKCNTGSGLFCSADRSAVERCNDTGTAVDTVEKCGVNNACDAGVCKPKVCTPNAGRCSDQDVYTCNSSGTAELYKQRCASSTHCVNGICVPDQCYIGQLSCQGTKLMACNALGSGFTEEAADCSLTGQTCFNSACRSKVCEVGVKQCGTSGSYEAVLTCTDEGTRLALSTTCGADQYCDSTSLTCKPRLCTPGVKACDGSKAGVCNAKGSSLDSAVDCATDGKVCHQGNCLPKLCEPTQRFCQLEAVYQCGSTGATSTLYQTCSSYQYCAASGGTASCQSDVCTQGQLGCDGNAVRQCSANGGSFTGTGTDCGTQSCDAGKCVPKVCEPGAYSCGTSGSTSFVRRCTANGARYETVQNCYSTEFCKEGVATCQADVCTAGAQCNGEAIATCLADGSGYATATEDCGAKGQVCTFTKACAASETSSVKVGDYSSGYSAQLFGNYYTVSRARKVTKIKQGVSVSGTQVFTWLVYEKESPAATYKKVYELVATGTATGSIESPALDYTLEAGKKYFIGVHVSERASATRCYMSYNSYCYYISSAAQALGFATVDGGATAPALANNVTLTATGFFEQSVTTVKAD